jgi:D-alanyl-D-alanine carboxypeptidase
MKKELKELLLKQIWFFVLVLWIFITIFFIWQYFEIKNLEKENKKILEKLVQNEKNLIKIKKELEKQRQEKELENYLNNLDLDSDNSITKFVNNKVHYNNLAYVPKNLVKVAWEHIIDGKNWYIKVRKILKENLEKMAKDFYKDTNNNIVVVSGYRSYKYQKWIKDRGCPDNLCAKAWYSEHQSWLAVDLYSASSLKNWTNNNNLNKYYYWLKENAWKYGFTNTYQKWLKVDWYEIEPWHWRYVWVKLAKYLLDNNMTFAEFYNEKKK